MYKRDERPDIILITGFTDFRCGINSLTMKLIEEFDLDPFGNCLYVFMSKSKDKMKILYWGGSGFWLLTYRLEEGKFKWLKNKDTKKITHEQMEWLLNGLEIEPKGYIKEYKRSVIL